MHDPLISILIPSRNEEKYIASVLDDVLAQDYPSDKVEILVIDGMSTDDSPKIMEDYAHRYPSISILKNKARYVPQAMNMGIRQARGKYLIRLDAHASYPPDYFSKLIFWSIKTAAENVGGRWVIKARNNSLQAKAIAIVLAHRLGVGNASYRVDKGAAVKECISVDTVPFGCFPKEVFERFGDYDIRLHRNQDIEFNKRIKARGGKILLAPDVECTYFARENFGALWKNNFANGDWVIRTVRYTGHFSALSLRHFIPLLFVVYLAFFLVLCGGMILGLLSKFAFLIFALPFLAYLSLLSIASLLLAYQEKKILLFPFLLFSFLTLHISYGCGSIAGFFRLR